MNVYEFPNFLLWQVYPSMYISSKSQAMHLQYMIQLAGKEPNKFVQLLKLVALKFHPWSQSIFSL